jgi:hypothetical protein
MHFCPKCETEMELQIDEENHCGTFYICPHCYEVVYVRTTRQGP